MTNRYWDAGSLTYLPSYGAEVGDFRYRNQNGVNRPTLLTREPPIYDKLERGLWSTSQTVTYKFRRASSRSSPKRVKNEPHAYQMTHYHKVNSLVTYVTEFGDTRTRGILEVFSHVVSPSSLWDSNDDIALIAKLQEKVFGSEFNLGVFLGEGRQALTLIADSAIRIAASLRHLRRGRLKDAWQDLVRGTSREKRSAPHKEKFVNPSKIDERIYADLWIEMQYGWKPLLSDVKSGAEALAAQLSEPFSLHYVAKRMKQESGERVTQTMSDGPITCTYYSCRGRVLRTTVSEKPGLAQLSRLDNPLTVAWELLPWSFVIDWFIPVGQWLDARGSSSIFNAGSVSSTLDKENCYVPMQGTTAIFRFDNLQRVVGGVSGSLPLPAFKPLSKVASWQHCANAIALLTQQARRTI
jgi:hypothetical protein